MSGNNVAEESNGHVPQAVSVVARTAAGYLLVVAVIVIQFRLQNLAGEFAGDMKPRWCISRLSRWNASTNASQ